MECWRLSCQFGRRVEYNHRSELGGWRRKEWWGKLFISVCSFMKICMIIMVYYMTNPTSLLLNATCFEIISNRKLYGKIIMWITSENIFAQHKTDSIKKKTQIDLLCTIPVVDNGKSITDFQFHLWNLFIGCETIFSTSFSPSFLTDR